MGYRFPSQDWADTLKDILNQDERYAEVARDWEGELLITIEMQDETQSPQAMTFFLDLWHGKCRQARLLNDSDPMPDARFKLTAPLKRMLDILGGNLDPVHAMMTRQLKVEGSMGYLMRNVPVILDFIRCCRLVDTDPVKGEAV